MRNSKFQTFLFLLFFALYNFCVHAFNADSLFYQANELYKEEKYDEALEAYQSILNSRYVSAELYFNIGNCYYKKNKLGLARFFYEKALQYSPFDDAINHNLDLILEALPGDIGYGLPSETEKFKFLISFSSFQKYIFIFSLILILAGGYFFFRYMSEKRKKYFAYFISLMALSMMLFFVTIWLNISRNSNYLILVSESAYVKNEPSENAIDLFIINEGIKVVLLEEYSRYVKIKMNDGKVGWAVRENFERIL